jgi:glc operon protein GlcG
MRTRTVLLLGIGVLLAAPARPEAASEAAAAFAVPKQSLTLTAARKVIEACEAEARRRGVGVVSVVVDEGGHVIQLSRMDEAQVASVEVGIGKARTAAIFRRPSRIFEEQIRSGRVAALALAGATPLQGGIPIAIDGVVVGAIGVSGDTPQIDEDIAIAGANALAPRALAVTGHGDVGGERR